ncbi:MAG: transposase [Candidatus Angelobacter sp.]|nr:transposase [Candidatus Angelobacter sp.]
MLRLAPQEIRTFFITSIASGRRPLFQTERMALLLIDVFRDNREKARLALHEYVVMPNHIHLLFTPAPENPLEKCAQFIKGGFSFRAKKELGTNSEIWQPSFTNIALRIREIMRSTGNTYMKTLCGQD